VIRVVESSIVATAGKLAALPAESLPEVAFAGRSNVGKSSLLNALAGRRALFKVSATPGRTRKIVHASARLSNGGALFVVDLPGYGYAKVAKAAKRAWGELLEAYLRRRATLVLVVLLVDARRGLEEEEAALLAFLAARRVPAVIAATKIDRLKKKDRKLALDALRRQAGVEVIGTSAEERTGIDVLCEVVAGACGHGTSGTTPPA
jgi:GTP-binding protein